MGEEMAKETSGVATTSQIDLLESMVHSDRSTDVDDDNVSRGQSSRTMTTKFQWTMMESMTLFQ